VWQDGGRNEEGEMRGEIVYGEEVAKVVMVGHA